MRKTGGWRMINKNKIFRLIIIFIFIMIGFTPYYLLFLPSNEITELNSFKLAIMFTHVIVGLGYMSFLLKNKSNFVKSEDRE